MPPSKIVKKITLFYLVQTSLLGQLSYRLGYQISAGKEKWTKWAVSINNPPNRIKVYNMSAQRSRVCIHSADKPTVRAVQTIEQRSINWAGGHIWHLTGRWISSADRWAGKNHIRLGLVKWYSVLELRRI